MTQSIGTPGVSGFSIDPRWDSKGQTVWHWRAWHNDAIEGNGAETYEEAADAVREAHSRLVELHSVT